MRQKDYLSKFPKIISYPFFSEKALNLYKFDQYTFIIQKNYNKQVLKFFFESLFNIKIKNIQKCKLITKKLTSNYYKVIIKIKNNDLRLFLTLLSSL